NPDGRSHLALVQHSLLLFRWTYENPRRSTADAVQSISAPATSAGAEGTVHYRSCNSLPVHSGRNSAAPAATTKKNANAPSARAVPPTLMNTGVDNGATIAATRPNAAALPAPVPRNAVG